MKRGLNRVKSVLILNSLKSHSIFKTHSCAARQLDHLSFQGSVSSSSIPFTVLASQQCNLSRYHSYVNVTQSIVDSSCLDRARISFHRHSSLFQDHGVDRCVTYLLAARSSCIHAMDASNTSRIFNPKPDVAACISKQSSISFPRFLSLSLPPSSPFLFLFHSFHFLPLFLFPPFITAHHWTWLGPVSLVNGIFSVALFVANLNGTHDCAHFVEKTGWENEFDGSIGKFELGDFNKHSRIWICLEYPFVDGFSLERDYDFVYK